MFKKKLLIKAILFVTIFSLVISTMPNILSDPPVKNYQPQNGVWLGEDYQHLREKSPAVSVGPVAISDGIYSVIFNKNTNEICIYDNINYPDPYIKKTYPIGADEVINSLSMSENSKFIAAGSDQGRVLMYNRYRLLRIPIINFQIPGDGNTVYSVSLQKDDLSRFLAAGTNKGIYCFDRAGFVDYRWNYHDDYPVHTVSVSNKSTLLGTVWVAAGDNAGNIMVFNAENIGPLPVAHWKYSSGACITKVVISDDGSNVVAGNGFGEILYFNNNLGTHPPLWTYNTSADISSISMSCNGDWIAVVTTDSNLYLFNSNYPVPLWKKTFNGPITSLSMSQDGRYIAVAVNGNNGDNRLCLFSQFNKAPLWNYSIDQNACIAMSRNGEEIVIGTNDHYYYLRDEYNIASDQTLESDNGEYNAIPFVLKIIHDPNGDGSHTDYSKSITNKIGFSIDVQSGNNVEYEWDNTLFQGIIGNFIKDITTEGSVSSEVQITYTTKDDFGSNREDDDWDFMGPRYGDSYLITMCHLNYQFNERDITGSDETIAAIPLIKFGLFCNNEIYLTNEYHLADYFRQDQIDFLHSLNIGYDNKIDTWGEKNLVQYIGDYVIEGGDPFTHSEEYQVYKSLSATLKISLSNSVIGQFGLSGENYGVSGRKLVRNDVSIGATATVSKTQDLSYSINVYDDEGADSLRFTLYEDKIFQTLLTITKPTSISSDPIEHWTNGDYEVSPNSPPEQTDLGIECWGTKYYHGTASASDPDIGDSVQYQFDWGDGFRDDWGDDSSSHGFTEYGNYLVKARARDQYDHEGIWSEPSSAPCSQAYDFQISTQQITQPTSTSTYTVAVGEPVSYQFYDVQNPEQLIEEWELTFGDGSFERNTEQQGTHSYDDPGFYLMNLSIDEGRYTSSKNITVIPVRADINTSTIWAEPNESILFHDASWNNTPLRDRVWNFGDNTSGNGEQVSHFYDEQGDYTVTLTVTDENDANDTCSQVVHVDTEPQIMGLNNTPDIVHIGGEVDIHADVYDLLFNRTDNCPISAVYANISFPDGSFGNYSMEYIGNESDIYSYELRFSDTKMVGAYSCTIWALDDTVHLVSAQSINAFSTYPEIKNVSITPTTLGFGNSVQIAVDVDPEAPIESVNLSILYPNQTCENFTMTQTDYDTYMYDFLNTWNTGKYNITIWALNDFGILSSSANHSFNVSANAIISIATLKNSYSGSQYINITDPPNPTENLTVVGRGLTWNTYYNASSGENILESYQGPVNYQDYNDTWKPINNSLYQLNSDHPAYNYGYRMGNEHGLFGVYFKPNVQNSWPIAFTYNRSDDPTLHVIRSKLVGVGYLDPASNWSYQYLQNAQSSQGQTNGNVVIYSNAFTGTDVSWSYGATELKEAITMSNTTKAVLQSHPPHLYGLHDASSFLVFITKLDYQNLDIYNTSGMLTGNVTITDKGVDFKDALGYFKCAMPLGEAYEQNNESVRQRLTYRIVHLNGNTYLLSGLKVSDLNAMMFPVVIDPTLTVYSISSDGYIYKSDTDYSRANTASTGTVDSSGAYITIGQKKGPGQPATYYIYRGFAYFDTSALPSNAYLDNATLSLYKKDDYSTTDFDITIQNGQPNSPHNPMQTSDYNKNYYSGNGGSLNTSRFSSGYNPIPLNNLNWINRNGITKLCLRSSRDINVRIPTGNEYVNVHSNEFLGMCPPKLMINYRNQSKIKNTGSTNIKGYLLMQVQFYSTLQGKWLVDKDTINETSPRTINSGSQLGLDNIFNGHVRASDLTHGAGTYRVYAAFRDLNGNILRTSSGVELKAWWQFTKT